MSENKDSEFRIRISSTFRQRLEDDQKKRGFRSIQEYGEQALNYFVAHEDRPEKTYTDAGEAMRLIVTMYDGKCFKCGRFIEKGSWALYGREIGLMCMDDYIQKIGDKTIMAKFLKNRELDQINRALKTENERLAQQVTSYQGIDKISGLITQEEKLNKLVLSYFSEGIGQPQEKEVFEEILRENEQSKRLIKDVEEYIQKVIETASWNKLTRKPHQFHE